MKNFLKIKAISKVTILITLAIVLNSCSVFQGLYGNAYTYTSLKSIKIIRADASNNNKYITVDVAYIYSEDIIKNLLPASPEAWFKKRDSYLSFDLQKMYVQTFEPIPLAIIDNIPLSGNIVSSHKTMLYVAYFSMEKYFEFDVTEYKNLQIILAKDNVYLSEQTNNLVKETKP